MQTTIFALDLTTQAPHSPRERLADFVIALRAIDKCHASLAGTAGEYHYDCPLDNMLFSFKGITGEQFKNAVEDSMSNQEVGTWLMNNGIKKTPTEIKAWSDEIEAYSPIGHPEKPTYFIENCKKLGLDPQTSSMFDWLEADDLASFKKPETK